MIRGVKQPYLDDNELGMVTGNEGSHIGLVALVVLFFLLLVEVVVGVAGAPGPAVGLEEAHVGLEREGDGGAAAAGGCGGGGGEEGGEREGAERGERRRRQRHGRVGEQAYGGLRFFYFF